MLLSCLLILITVITTSNQGYAPPTPPHYGKKMCVTIMYDYGIRWSNLTYSQKRMWCWGFSFVDRVGQVKEHNCVIEGELRTNLEEAHEMCSIQKGTIRKILDYTPIPQDEFIAEICKKFSENLKQWGSDDGGGEKKRENACEKFTTSSDQMGNEVHCDFSDKEKDLLDKAVKDCPKQAPIIGKIKENTSTNMISASPLSILLSIILGYIFTSLQKIEL